MRLVYILDPGSSLLVNRILARNTAIYIWPWNDKAEEAFLNDPSTKNASSLASQQSHRLELLWYEWHDVDHRYNEETRMTSCQGRRKELAWKP